jgi:GT2 family glycosyltransferase
MVQLSVIIVNYNVKYFLKQTLLSVYRAAQNLKIEVIVVDNNSTDNSKELIQKNFPDVIYIYNKQNLGFSKANNIGIKQSKGEFVLLLNPDTAIAEDTLDICYAFMQENLHCGAVGVRMVDGSGNFLPESKRGLPTPKASFYKVFGLSSLFPNSPKFGSYHLKYLKENEVNQVDVLSGAFMFMRQEALQKAGLLDESFFMYGEDIDLSYRIVLAGYSNFYLPTTSIIHYKGESTKKNSLNYVKVFYNAMIIFARKHFSKKLGNWFAVLIYFAVYLRAFLSVSKRVYLYLIPRVAEFLMLYLIFFGITRYWEMYNKWVPGGLYPQEYYSVHLPLYSTLLIMGLQLSGAYKQFFSGKHLLRGFGIGMVLLLVFYGFLPESLRFSRAILGLGALLGLGFVQFYRSVFHFFVNNSLSLSSSKRKKSIVVGNYTSFLKVKNIVGKNNLPINVLGFVSDEDEEKEFKLSNLQSLEETVAFYKAEELVFCADNLSYKQIIQFFNNKSFNRIQLEILPNASNFIIGSYSKNEQGKLYSFENEFSIGTKKAVLRKRVFDLVFSLFLLFLYPVYFKLIKNKSFELNDLLAVIVGKKTLVGYNSTEQIENLPELKEGVWELHQMTQGSNNDMVSVQNQNVYYAAHYTWNFDLHLLSLKFALQFDNKK